MKKIRLVSCMIVICLAALPATTPAEAGIVINATEFDGGVIFEGGGTLDLRLWRPAREGPAIARVLPSRILVIGTGEDRDIYIIPINFVGPKSIGPGTHETFADFAEGDGVGINWRAPSIGVPDGYTTGVQLNGSATFIGHTFASLGVEEGSYTWTWDTVDGKGDFFTINIIVPAPGALFLLGVAGFTHRRRRS